MSSYYGPEIATQLIDAQIKATIATNLANVRGERTNAVVTTEPPREYFVYHPAHVYRPPAIFTLFEKMRITNTSSNGNHINAKDQLTVACVIEDRSENLLTIKAWRYQAALMQSLHQVVLTNADQTLKLFILVDECVFTEPYAINNDSNANVFRKEVGLRLVVDHIENLE